MLINLVYPDYTPKIKRDNGQLYVRCIIRKKWLIMTPEEWVRQNFINYLIEIKGYPKANIAVEKEIKVQERQKRFDIVVYNAQMDIEVLVECKKETEDLNNAVWQQVINYQSTLNSNYLIITNGRFAMACAIRPQMQMLLEIPFLEKTQ